MIRDVHLLSLILVTVALVGVAVQWIVRRRRRRMTEGEFLRLVIRAVRYDDSDMVLQPPGPKQERDDASAAARAQRTLRELLRTVEDA